ncbi:MAG: ribulose-phosphate 3-epimerase [Myxococcota bacterium]
MLSKNKVYIAPSILSADFSRLSDEIKDVESSGVDIIHIDVMDGIFVPNITIGPQIIKSLRKITRLPFDVHLMIENPDRYIDDFAIAGSDIITVHLEASRHLHRTIQKIKEASDRFNRELSNRSFDKILCGVSINPHTPISAIEEIINEIDLLLIMTVNPGFGGQKFIDSMINKISKANQLLGRTEVLIEVDGGVNDMNAKSLIENGVQILVAGNYIFSAKDRREAIKRLRG